MIANKNLTKIIIALMAIAVILSFISVIFADKISDALGGNSISMQYESELFDTSEIITVDIQMDEDDWNAMLANAMSEEYYVCDVVINGTKISNVGIRPKGNTSLSAIVSDPDTDRYSLKLEFDHYVDEQTCFGLDKLILNNNYADATNMKEAIIYDMYKYLGADASLYNYAEVSVNGEYWGIYLALEAVEESFALRNYGTQDGEIYKPENMGIGGGNNSSKSELSMPGGMNFSSTDNSDKPSSEAQNTDSKLIADTTSFDVGNMPDVDSSNFKPGNMPNMDSSNFGPGNMPNMDDSSNSPPNMPNFDNSNFSPDNMPNMNRPNFNTDNVQNPNESAVNSDRIQNSEGYNTDKSSTNNGESFTHADKGGGFSQATGGSDLNYTDDDLDSYSTIWEGEITDTTDSDHRRVVTALKNISEGTDLESYLDIDNILKYMAVHTFAVNMDSLSGNMAHNYYLYEYNGKLNLIPWDYNLSFGGMSMGNSGNASDMINDPIDTPFSGTDFFDALLENEEYLAKYHEYLQMLVDEYVNGGRFDEIYNRIRSQIDYLVETDPTAFYSYDEYVAAADMVYNTVKLRAESISGQLDGTIPSTDDGQRADSSNLVDASSIDVSVMGQFSMGMGGGFGGNTSSNNSSSSSNESAENSDDSIEQSNLLGPDVVIPSDASTDADSSATIEQPTMPGMDKSGSSERPDFGSSNFDKSNFDTSSLPGKTSNQQNTTQGWIVIGLCFAVMVLALVVLKIYKRRKYISSK